MHTLHARVFLLTLACACVDVQPELIPPQGSDMETIKHHLDKMQRAYSPIKKLENLLSATSAIYASVKVYYLTLSSIKEF